MAWTTSLYLIIFVYLCYIKIALTTTAMTSTNRPNLKRRATQRGAHENVNVSYYASPLQHQRTPKRSRLNDTPLSPSREHGNTSTEGWSTLSQVEESRWSWDHEEPIHEGVASTQHIYDEPQNNVSQSYHCSER
jgi:hypothetical protein